jgi:hypothetical protein
MKAKIVNFERGADPKSSMKIGKDRYKQTGDIEFGKHFLYRNPNNDNKVTIVNALNGKEYSVGLFAAKEVVQALENLLD